MDPLIIVAIVLLLLAAGVGIYFYNKQNSDEVDDLSYEVDDSSYEVDDSVAVEDEMPSATPETKEYSTPDDSDDGYKVSSLEKHNVECSNGALNQFRLQRVKDSSGERNRIKYQYTCNDNVVGAGEAKTTPADIVRDAAYDVVFLDRHNVDCGSSPIRQFQLHRPSSGKLEYKYTCGDKSVDTSTCRDVTTKGEPLHNTVYLDRQNVKCETDEYITQFKLNKKEGDKRSYGYKCCKLNN